LQESWQFYWPAINIKNLLYVLPVFVIDMEDLLMILFLFLNIPSCIVFLVILTLKTEAYSKTDATMVTVS